MSKGKILIVDDSEIVLEAASIVLEDAGYEVFTESSPFKLNGAIKAHQPDLLLLDVQMPALSGERAAQILKQYKFTKEVPILLYSGLEEDELKRLVPITGASGYLRKRTLSEGLAEEVEPWMAKARLKLLS